MSNPGSSPSTTMYRLAAIQTQSSYLPSQIQQKTRPWSLDRQPVLFVFVVKLNYESLLRRFFPLGETAVKCKESPGKYPSVFSARCASFVTSALNGPHVIRG